MKLVKLLLQVLALCAISFVGNILADILQIGIPGNILGILLLLGLFAANILSVDKIEMGANFLIAELLLFFIPSATGIIQYQEILQKDWSQLLMVIEFSIIAVILFVGFATEFVIRYRGERG